MTDLVYDLDTYVYRIKSKGQDFALFFFLFFFLIFLRYMILIFIGEF
jgi:hypothetical protein